MRIGIWSNRPIFWTALGVLALAVACDASRALESDGGLAEPGVSQGTGATTGLGPGQDPTPPPETELESSFRQPVVTGSVLFTANPQTNRVAQIDAASLQISVADAGNGPTYLAALAPGETTGGALVTNVRSGDASVLLLADDGILTSQLVRLQAGASAWATGPLGRHAISWSRASEGLLGASDGYQDIMVLSFSAADISTKQLSVGYRPSQVVLSQDESHAFAVAEPGITVIALSGDEPQVEREIFLPEQAAGTRDVSITPDGSLALVRISGESDLTVVDLATGSVRTIALPAVMSDLDLSEDGSTALAVMRGVSPNALPPEGQGGSAGGPGGAGGEGPDGGSAVLSRVAVFDVSELAQGGDKYDLLELEAFVGSVVVSANGEQAMLFTNAVASSEVVLLDVLAGKVRTVDVKVAARAGFVAPDGSFGVMLLQPTVGDSPGAFAMIPLEETRPVRLQGTGAPPQFVSLTTSRALITTGALASRTAEAYLGRYPELSVDRHELPSRPLSTGIVPDAGQAFIAQEHPEGRVTFVDLESGQPRTVSGFELSSRVVDR